MDIWHRIAVVTSKVDLFYAVQLSMHTVDHKTWQFIRAENLVLFYAREIRHLKFLFAALNYFVFVYGACWRLFLGEIGVTWAP